MIDTDGFFYTKKESIFIPPKDLSKEFKNYLKDNSTVEIEIYMSLLGSLDDQLKFVIPSIYEIYSLDDTPKKFYDIIDLNDDYYSEFYNYDEDSLIIDTKGILEKCKEDILGIIEEMLTNHVGSSSKFTYCSPWLIDIKDRRKEKLNKIGKQ